MSERDKKSIPLVLHCVDVRQGANLGLPGFLRTTTRAGAGEIDPLLAGVKVEKVYLLGSAARGGPPGETQKIAEPRGQLLAIEADDGTALFIRSDKLAEDIARLCPKAINEQGEVDFAKFRDPKAAARGLTDVFWKAVSILTLPADDLVEQAKELARDWAGRKLGETFPRVEQRVYDHATVLGAKALMWTIESRLAGRSGLYRWQEASVSATDRCLPGDPRLADLAQGKPALILIHGTASYTQGSFSDLREDQVTWDALTRRFTGGIFGYEHRTFSQSPIENALELLDALPAGAAVSLLTHSRGGLVGDLLCLSPVGDEVIETYRIEAGDATDAEGLEREALEERERLRTLRDRLRDKRLKVERYVRVACPARGTRFLSDHLEAALSDFLNVVQTAGGALLGVACSSVGGPVAGGGAGSGASSALGVLKRLVLEIVDKRIDPRLVPGLAAMRIDSPLAAFLAHPQTRRRDGIAMAVIAGDTEFDGLGFGNIRRRVANLFCDWRLFDQQDNDLVVDTESMYAGLARDGAYYLYDQDASVTHFRYFRNPTTRDALRDWLAKDDPSARESFQPLTGARRIAWSERAAQWATRGMGGAGRPVVILIPGIMGSHIEIHRKKPGRPGSGNRIWFDAVSLSVGNLDKIGDPNAPKVYAEDIWELLYGDLADYLAETHTVIRSAYDWRKPLIECAETLGEHIERAATTHPGHPIRLLAHSMGGLVVRTLMKTHPETWQRVVDSGGRLVMLGTPNNGTHLMVHTLLGKSDSMRMLERLDVTHDLQEILDIVARFPGALSLLPRPGFADAGDEPRIAPVEYYAVDTWKELKAKNVDHWYGNGICGVTRPETLEIAAAFWMEVLANNTIANPERVSYVFGQSARTPCGVTRTEKDMLKLLFTADGDGSVTWASGWLDNLGEERCWYMPVEHADLTGTEEHFPAIAELLEKGGTARLGRLPRRRGSEASRAFILEASPPVIPTEEELARAFLGSGPRRRKPSRERQALRVSVYAGDIRYLDQTVLCGHYAGDAIAGAEATLDAMLDGRLSERERLGIYATGVGTSAIVLRAANSEQRARGSQLGAVIVGLGEFNGQLSASEVTETVRASVVRYLLQLRDVLGVLPDDGVRLNSVLLGWNSTAHITIPESVAAVTRGVLEANRQFSEALSKSRERGARVTDLCFVEVFRDAAITAAHAVLDLPRELDHELKRLDARIEPARALTVGNGVRERLYADDRQGYWPRLIVTDPDALDTTCSPECHETPRRPPNPTDVLQRLCGRGSPGEQAGEGEAAAVRQGKVRGTSRADQQYYPQRLKYVFLSQRARAEQIVQQRQPSLIEAIVREQRHNPAYDAKLGRILFQLMVPLDYKAAAREQDNLIVVLDKYTAPLPWELLQAEDVPLSVTTRMVRQLATPTYRRSVRTAHTDSACIIVAPDTEGFDKRFGGGTPRLDDLPAASREGEVVRASLRAAGWEDRNIVYCPAGKTALDVLAILYQQPYRLLMISAHGVFEAEAADGNRYSGIVLSDGLLLSAVEIGLMEVVPEIVFLNCCHLGGISNVYSAPNRLAYSLANELIEMGVRCVVAAGWAVNDDAACTFASVFFDRITHGAGFGDALFEARRATYQQHPGSNTWGAYQAYGDFSYRLDGRAEHPSIRLRPYVAVEELLLDLRARREQDEQAKGSGKRPTFAELSQWVARCLTKCPPDWSERPDVLQALGELYAEYGDEGFFLARDAYERALQGETRQGAVSLKVIEQLASLEARQGTALADQGKIDEGVRLIDRAIARLHSLADLTRREGASLRNVERAALRGSALERKAAALVRKPETTWSDVVGILKESAAAYLESGGASDPAESPDNTLNALRLAWLSGSLDAIPNSAELALRCGVEARRRFAVGKDFGDAVLSADAVLMAWLLGEVLDDPIRALARVYDEAADTVPQSAREWDSVVTQLRLLAGCLRLRAAEGDQAKSLVLEQLALYLDPMSQDFGSASGVTAGAAENTAEVGAPTARAGRNIPHVP